MFATEWLALPISRLITLTLLHFVWQGLAVAAILLFMVEACRVRRAGARYACSLVALVAMVLAPLATLGVLIARSGGGSELVLGGLDLALVSPPAVVSFWGYWLQRVEPAVLAAWCCGVVLFGGRLLTGAVGVARLRRNALPVPPKLFAVIEQLGQRLRMDAAGLVMLSHQVTDAMAVGLVRPLVLIPAVWVTEMPLEMLEAVIAHELAHLARRDLWVNLLQRIVETVLFYHPAVWWLSRRLRIERELCADDLAVAATGKRLEYAQALEQIAGERLADIRPALAAFLRGENDMRLLQRVRNVLKQSPEERSRLWPAGLAALALPLGLWAVAAWSDPAVANDERDDDNKPVFRRERAERDEVKRATERLERVKKEAEKRATVDKERGTRVSENNNRDGKKPELAEVREERFITIHDGQAPEQVVERRIVTRDGKPIIMEFRKDGPASEQIVEKVTVVKDGKPVTETVTGKQRDNAGDRRIDELTALVKQLSQNVERLQNEVSRLRAEKQGGEFKSNQFNQSRRDEEGRSSLEFRKRELQQDMEKVETAKRDLEAQAKAIQQQAQERVEAFNRAASERVEAEARAAKQQAEAARRAAVDQKEEAERSRLRKVEEERRPEASSASPKKIIDMRDKTREEREEALRELRKEREILGRAKEDGRSVEGSELPQKTIDTRGLREKTRADQEKAREEIKNLEQRLKQLQNQDTAVRAAKEKELATAAKEIEASRQQAEAARKAIEDQIRKLKEEAARDKTSAERQTIEEKVGKLRDGVNEIEASGAKTEVERKSDAIHPDQFRVAPGFGFRIDVPAMGPAPLAFDFAFPVGAKTEANRKLIDDQIHKLKERRVEPTAEQESELDLNDEVFKKLQRD